MNATAERDGGKGKGVREILDTLYRTSSRQVLSTLIRLLGDFDAAEEALHEAFAAAAEKWPAGGVPANPRAWLISAGRFRAIDSMRKQARFDPTAGRFGDEIPGPGTGPEGDHADDIDNAVRDDELRLIFTCCHPALPVEGRVALTLREVCGLTTEEIARAFLTSAPTIAQRIVRAKAKIRDKRIPYRVPAPADLAERLASVLQVVYLVFNEGYSATSGESLVRSDLSAEAIRLGRLLAGLKPEPEAIGLLGLMLLQESRRVARTSPAGDLVLLEEQNRSLWNRDQIAEGKALADQALASRRFGPYTLQAAIAAVHAEAPDPAFTDWGRIASLYDVLLQIEPSPVIELNRAVAIAMRDGPEAGLALIDPLLAGPEMSGYHLAHSARADLCRRLGLKEEARRSYIRALELTRLGPEKRFLERRLAELG